MSDRDELVLLPSLKGQRGPNGGLVLTRKYIEGVAEYARTWPGPVTSLINLNETPTTDMDHVEVLPGDPVASIEPRPDGEAALAARLEKAAVALAFLAPSEAPLGALCARIGLPLVYTAEYSPATECQVIDAETANPILRFRRKLWVRNATRIRRGMLARAAGLQCSGTPVYEAYGADNRNCLLFFDSRVRLSEVLTEAEMEAKAAALVRGAPLRLVFGGRLIAMKGVMDLPPLATALVRRGVDFSFHIYGTGPLEGALREAIDRAGLADRVRLMGARDFRTGWIPVLKQEADLFVCPHPQGDPSSTYPEVMSCGTAIAGYDNEAFLGIARASGSGWPMPMRNVAALADRIAALDGDRATLAAAARQARAFALRHAFEITFAARTAHLIAASRLPAALRKPVPAGQPGADAAGDAVS